MAIEGFKRACELRPFKHTHFTCLGKVYLRWGGHEQEALEVLTRSLEIVRTAAASRLEVKARAAMERKLATLRKAQVKSSEVSCIAAFLDGDTVQNGSHVAKTVHCTDGYRDECSDDPSSTLSEWTGITSENASTGSVSETADGQSVAAALTPRRSLSPREEAMPIIWEHGWWLSSDTKESPKLPTPVTRQLPTKTFVGDHSSRKYLITGAPPGLVAKIVAMVEAAAWNGFTRKGEISPVWDQEAQRLDSAPPGTE